MRIALLGAGRWATEFTAPAISQAARLSGVWSRRRDQAELLARRFGVGVFDTPGQAARSSDGVAVAVEPGAQLEMAAASARYGRPILLEKPLAASLSEATELAAILDAREIKSLVVMTYRFLPVARQLLDLGSQGLCNNATAVFLTSGHRGEPAQSWRHRDGAIGDVGTHVLDLLSMVLGPLAVASACHVDGTVYGVINGPAGRRGNMIFSTTAPVENRVTMVQTDHPDGQRVFGPSSFRRPPGLGATVVRSFLKRAAGAEVPHLVDHRGALALQRLVAQLADYSDAAQNGKVPLIHRKVTPHE